MLQGLFENTDAPWAMIRLEKSSRVSCDQAARGFTKNVRLAIDEGTSPPKHWSHQEATDAVHCSFDLRLDLEPIRATLCEFVNLFGSKYALESVSVRDEAC